MMFSFTQQLVMAALGGLLSYRGYFIRGEHDVQAANIVRFHIIISAVIGYFKRECEGSATSNVLKETLFLLGVYSATIFTSMLVFRLFLSPLRLVPGPMKMKWSKIPHMWDMARNQNCKLLHELHLKYGDIVRTGPNELTLFGLDAYNAVHGPRSRALRAAYYDILNPLDSLDTVRDEKIHAHRRRIWEQAFSIKSLDNAGPIIYFRAQELVRQLQKRSGKSINVSRWLEYYTFDVMGLFGLAIDFKNLTEGEHPILKIYHMAHHLMGPLAAVPWLKHIIMGIPFIKRVRYYREFFGWAHRELERNIHNNPDKRQNLIGYVLSDAENSGGIKSNWNFVLGDFTLVIIAGSDPVRQVLCNVLYYLLKKPEHLEKVRGELGNIDVNDYKMLQHCEHLNSVIHETIRLNPPVPSAGLRLAPRGGMVINDMYIPEGTTLVTPQYSLMRDPRYYESPEEWIPERFSTNPELILNKDAFVAWTIGNKSCLGKNLSLMEIRIALAEVLEAFNFDFAPGEDGTEMFTKATDFFTTTPGPLSLVFERRVKV